MRNPCWSKKQWSKELWSMNTNSKRISCRKKNKFKSNRHLKLSSLQTNSGSNLKKQNKISFCWSRAKSCEWWKKRGITKPWSTKWKRQLWKSSLKWSLKAKKRTSPLLNPWWSSQSENGEKPWSKALWLLSIYWVTDLAIFFKILPISSRLSTWVHWSSARTRQPRWQFN